MLPPLALVLMWNVSCTPAREPSEPDKTALKVLVAAPFVQVAVFAEPRGEVTRGARVGRVIRDERDRPLRRAGQVERAVGERRELEDAGLGGAGHPPPYPPAARPGIAGLLFGPATPA